MAVDNASQIDAIANDKENACLVLLITDHLNWDNEFEHLCVYPLWTCRPQTT